jgi:prephenate dehydrogenase
MATSIPFGSIAVVGFGLIGASVCKAVREVASEVHLVAIDVDAVVEDEEARTLVNELIPALDTKRVSRALSKSELTVLAVPVGAICDALPFVLDHAPLVTDCGSTKRAVVQTADRYKNKLRFIPGHPMAGGPQGGFRAARASLFRDQTWILCSDFGISPAFESVEEFVRALGAQPLRMDCDQHDAAVALTSHIPQLLSSALVTLAAEADAEGAAGPTYRNVTRAAGGNIEMWRDIFASNADQVARISRELGELLVCVAADLDRGEVDAALRVLESARSLRTQFAKA